MRRNIAAFLLILPLFLVIGACNNNDDDESPFPSAPPSNPATIKIVNPANGDHVDFSAPVTVNVHIEGLTLDCANVGGGNIPGHGHWHVYVDGKYENLSCTDTVSFTDTSIAPGNHTISVSLVRNDHTVIDSLTDDFIGVTY